MSGSATDLYFAYGSNLLARRLRERTPSARPVSIATLAGHELRWHKRGRDGSGKCDIVPSADPAAAVIGVVYAIALAEKPALDAAEGLGRAYGEQRVIVQAAAGPVEAWTYQALDIDPSAVPFTWYKALVVAGAREHGLPPAYVAGLESVAAVEDPDRDNAAKNFRLVRGR